jgi:hypothetical protein
VQAEAFASADAFTLNLKKGRPVPGQVPGGRGHEDFDVRMGE